MCNDTIDFSFAITCDAGLKQEFGAVDNEALFLPQIRACFPTVGTRTEKFLEKCFRGDVIDTFLHSSDLKTASNNRLAFVWLL